MKKHKPKQKRVSLKPRTATEWAAYRCQLSCKIGRDVLEGKTKPPVGCSAQEWALFNMLHAIEELSRLHSSKAT